MILERQLGSRLLGVHRLDRATSGVLIFAKHASSAQQLSSEFRDRQVVKKYLALVRGHVPLSPDWTVIDRPLTKLLKTGEESERKPALSFYRSLQNLTYPYPVGRYPEARYSLLEVKIETGLTHQIRRHLAGISHPIVGDTAYGDGRHNQATREHWGIQRLFLHSTQLSFPRLGIDLHSPMPATWERVLQGALSAECSAFASHATGPRGGNEHN